MRTYMAKLGEFTFGLETAAFQELQRSSSYRWQAKDRIGRKPAQQNTGQGADTINLNGVIYPHFKGGLKQLTELRAQAAQAKPLRLVYTLDKVGQYCGQWCITGIEETRTVFFENGAPRKIEFRLSLVEYGEDDGVESFVAPILAGASVAASSTAAATSAGTLKSATAAATDQSSAMSMVARCASTARDVANTVSTNIKAITNSEAVRLVKTAVGQIRAATSAAKAIKSAATQLSRAGTDPAAALTALSNLSAASGTMYDTLNSATTLLGGTTSNYGGTATSSTYYKQEIQSASSSLRSLASAASSLKSSANQLKALM